jgi:hypothetical protein
MCTPHKTAKSGKSNQGRPRAATVNAETEKHQTLDKTITAPARGGLKPGAAYYSNDVTITVQDLKDPTTHREVELKAGIVACAGEAMHVYDLESGNLFDLEGWSDGRIEFCMSETVDRLQKHHADLIAAGLTEDEIELLHPLSTKVMFKCTCHAGYTAMALHRCVTRIWSPAPNFRRWEELLDCMFRNRGEVNVGHHVWFRRSVMVGTPQEQYVYHIFLDPKTAPSMAVLGAVEGRPDHQ